MSSPEQIYSLYSLPLTIYRYELSPSVEKVTALAPLSNKEGLLLVLVIQELGRSQQNC